MFAEFCFIVCHYHFFIVITSLLFARMPVLVLYIFAFYSVYNPDVNRDVCSQDIKTDVRQF